MYKFFLQTVLKGSILLPFLNISGHTHYVKPRKVIYRTCPSARLSPLSTMEKPSPSPVWPSPLLESLSLSLWPLPPLLQSIL
jgi:hypothetical protein